MTIIIHNKIVVQCNIFLNCRCLYYTEVGEWGPAWRDFDRTITSVPIIGLKNNKFAILVWISFLMDESDVITLPESPEQKNEMFLCGAGGRASVEDFTSAAGEAIELC